MERGAAVPAMLISMVELEQNEVVDNMIQVKKPYPTGCACMGAPSTCANQSRAAMT